MCGIVAVFNFDGAPVDSNRLRKSVECLTHRGPDSSLTWIGGSTNHVGLAHTRLSIIDLVGGVQPLHSNNAATIVNGEFYDYKKIRREFIAGNYHFTTESDSEILLPLFDKLGVNCFKYLRGEFAFAHFHKKSERLILARDRFGIKPLYVYADSKQLIAASEVKSIFAYGISAEWNMAAVYRFITRYILDPVETFFKGITQVVPGSFLSVSSQGIDSQQYWNLDFNQQSIIPSDEQEIVTEFSSLLHEAVNLRLVADVPVGVYLSGGLDSNAVLALAHKASRGPLNAFTIKLRDTLYDESPLAIESAKALGCNIEVIEVSEDDFVENFEKALWHSEFLFTNPHGIAKFLLSQKVHECGYRVVLTGEGSDEILGGYAHFRLDYFKDKIADQNLLNFEIDSLFKTNEISRGAIIAKSTLKYRDIDQILGYTPEFFVAPEWADSLTREFFNQDIVQEFESQNHFRALFSKIDLCPIANADHMHRSMYLWMKTVFPNYLLNVLGDRMEMAHSVEARLPFLDHKLIEFTERVGSSWKFKNNIDKYLLRQSIKEIIPPKILARQKHPFFAPPACQNPTGKLLQYYNEIIETSASQHMGIFDLEKLRTTMKSLPQMSIEERRTIDPIITSIVSCILLGKVFGIR